MFCVGSADFSFRASQGDIFKVLRTIFCLKNGKWSIFRLTLPAQQRHQHRHCHGISPDKDLTIFQDSFRQTKPKQAWFMSFSEGADLKQSSCELFQVPKEKHVISQESVKFMIFCFGAFLDFGLLGRLLILDGISTVSV